MELEGFVGMQFVRKLNVVLVTLVVLLYLTSLLVIVIVVLGHVTHPATGSFPE
jgi:hypothetical protein